MEDTLGPREVQLGVPGVSITRALVGTRAVHTDMAGRGMITEATLSYNVPLLSTSFAALFGKCVLFSSMIPSLFLQTYLLK